MVFIFLILKVALQQNGTIFSTNQTGLLVLTLAFSHLVIISILLMYMINNGIVIFMFFESTSSHAYSTTTSEREFGQKNCNYLILFPSSSINEVFFRRFKNIKVCTDCKYI